jgi:ABC-type amino acid transport substrate-binding protein
MKSSTVSALALLAALTAPAAFAQDASSAQQPGAQEPSGPNMDEVTDTLERSKAKGVLTGCAYPYTFPFAQVNSDPPGFDVEIFRALAKRAGMRIDMYWVNVRSRASVQRAFRDSILANRCDVFLSLGESGDEEDDEDMGMHKLTFTKPHMSLAYVLAVQGKAEGMKTIDELNKADIKIGVNMSTPADGWLFDKGIKRALYFGEDRLMKGMADGEIDAALLWAPSFGAAKQRFPNAKFHLVEGYQPLPEHRFNMRFAVRKEDKSLLEFLNQGIDEFLGSGRIRQTVESYSVPYYPPLS